ncbi:sialate O-acetylesterase [Aquirufa sp. Wall-65K1]
MLAQSINGILFDKLPQDYQLYPRNSDNVSKITISGSCNSSDYNAVSIWVYRNNQKFSYVKTPTSPKQGRGFFQTEVTIKAELANYEVRVYAIKNLDSFLVVNKRNIVSGDVFLVSGQSNSYNGKENSQVYKGEFARSFGKYPEYTNTSTYNPADTLWSISNSPADVGLWASQIQKHIIEEQKIPVCIINGGSGGSSMEYNLARGTEKTDLTQSSGRLYYRVMKAGLLNSVKAFLYRQGENDANGNAQGWLSNFKKHVELLKQEYPTIEKIYLPQINVINGDFILQSLLRNDQRKILQENPFIQGFATVGTKGHDGIHYTPEGYFQSAWEMYRLLDRDFYSKKINKSYESPNIKRAFFGTEDKKSIILEFDDMQEMVVQNDTTLINKSGQNYTRKIQENFYLNAIAYPQLRYNEITTVQAYKNRVILSLSKAPEEKKISYLPSYFPKENLDVFPGPYLKNKAGMRAFSFENISIEPFVNLDHKSTFYAIPQNYQLYPRNPQTNLGEIVISGDEKSENYKQISAILTANNVIKKYIKSTLQYENKKAEWLFKLPIKAERINYSVDIYLITSSEDSIKILSRDHLVAGDIFLMNGGINASAALNESDKDEFARTFGGNTLNNNIGDYSNSDTLWSVSNSLGYKNNVGTFAFSFQKTITESLQIPIALLNLSDHHSTTEGLLKSAMDPSSLRTNYGKMLYRIEKAGLKNQVKAYIFRHGEIDSDKIAQSTITSVNQLIQDLKDDFPGLEKIVLCQNDIGDHPSENGAILREFQRTITRKFPMVIPFSTLGTKGFTGSIYSKEGYQSNGREIAQLLLLQVYQLGNSDVENGAPNLKKVYQSRANPEKLTLEFEKGQNIQFPGTFTHPSGKKLEINEFINVDNFAFQIKKATVNGHKIELDLVSNTPKNTISYLPSFVSSNYYFFPYLGPYIQNSKGKNAFSFYQVKIQKALSAPKILEKQKKWDLISIQWENLPQASSYQLLRKKSGETNFQVMGQFTPSTNSFSEIPAKLNTSYEYQLIAQNDSTESDPAMITISVPDSLNSIPLSLVKQEKLSIPLIWPKVADASKYVLSRQGPGEPFKTIYQGNEIQFEDKEITAGISYVYKMQYFTETGISQTSYLKAKTELTLGTENEAKNGIRIFPNPSKNQMTLEFGEHISGQVFLVNMNGMHLKQWGIFHQNSLEISLADYPEGSYFIQIQNEQWPSDLIYKVVRIP